MVSKPDFLAIEGKIYSCFFLINFTPCTDDSIYSTKLLASMDDPGSHVLDN